VGTSRSPLKSSCACAPCACVGLVTVFVTVLQWHEKINKLAKLKKGDFPDMAENNLKIAAMTVCIIHMNVNYANMLLANRNAQCLIT